MSIEQEIRGALADEAVFNEFEDRIGEAIAAISGAVHSAIERREPLVEGSWQDVKREDELEAAFSPLYPELAAQLWPIACQRFMTAAVSRS